MQCPCKNYMTILNGCLYSAVLEKFPSRLYRAVGRAGLDSRKEDDVWCICSSLCAAAARTITSSDLLRFQAAYDGNHKGLIYRILLHDASE